MTYSVGVSGATYAGIDMYLNMHRVVSAMIFEFMRFLVRDVRSGYRSTDGAQRYQVGFGFDLSNL